MFKSFLRYQSVSGPIVVVFVTLFMVGCSKKIAPVSGSSGLSNDGSASASTKAPSERSTSKKAFSGKGSENARPSNGGVTDEALAKKTPSERAPSEGSTSTGSTSTGSSSHKQGTGDAASPDKLASKSPRHDSQGRPFGDKGASNAPERGQTRKGTGNVLSNDGPSFMENVYFDYDKAIVRGDTKTALEENSRWLALNSSIKIQIEGHGDERGTNDYNLALGERRARSIMRYLINLGINKSRFSFISYGEERSVCSDQDEACYQKNRRVHFLVKR